MSWVLCKVLRHSDEHEHSSEDARKINGECQHNKVRASLVVLDRYGRPCLVMRGELHTDFLPIPPRLQCSNQAMLLPLNLCTSPRHPTEAPIPAVGHDSTPLSTQMPALLGLYNGFGLYYLERQECSQEKQECSKAGRKQMRSSWGYLGNKETREWS